MSRLESLFAKRRNKISLSLACEKLWSTSLYSVASLIKMIEIRNPNCPKRLLSLEEKRRHFSVFSVSCKGQGCPGRIRALVGILIVPQVLCSSESSNVKNDAPGYQKHKL